jgi:hypothetical protein
MKINLEHGVMGHMSGTFTTLPPHKVDRPQSMSCISFPFSQLFSICFPSVKGLGISQKTIPCISICCGVLGTLGVFHGIQPCCLGGCFPQVPRSNLYGLD